MATQIVYLDLRAAARIVQLRDDVASVMVVVSDNGRPVELFQLRRPADGILRSDVILADRALVETRSDASTRAGVPASIVVCTRERPDDLARCLARLACFHADGHEVTVVDNAPVTGRTRAVVEGFGFRYVLERTPGLNRARNAGLGAATHDIVAYIDDDVVVGGGWLAAIIACFDEPAVGCVTGLVLPLELETPAQEEFEVYCRHRRDLHRRIYSRRVLQPSAAGIVGMGANMAFRRTLATSLGGFDVRLDAGTRTRSGGDTDMFARVLDSGQEIVYTPDAPVWHRHRRSASDLRSCVFGYGVGLYSMLTKRLIEQRDAAALITGARWLIGPPLKAAYAKIAGSPAPRWEIVLAETAGALCGPFYFAYEAWRNRTPVSH
jgi:GT2 family glycosyltransferase